MSFQISDIVLYSHDGRRRLLKLKPGEVNVITGDSKTGKSALISIVDYVLGSGKCGVPEGPIRRAVSWFGLRLQLKKGTAFVARRCPSPGAESSQECFIEVGRDIDVPESPALRQTTNLDGLLGQVNGWAGISDHLNEPPSGQTRLPVSAGIRHALALCFQPQDEILRKDQLFHGAGDNWVAQALKDTLPYFLGAVDEDHVRKAEELRRLRGDLRTVERQLLEMKSLVGEGTSKADALVAQARDAALTSVVPDSWEAAVTALRAVAAIPLVAFDSAEAEGGEHARLAEQRTKLQAQARRLRDEISAARSFSQDEKGFSEEAREQQARLQSIGIFEGARAGADCPLCKRGLPDDGGSLTELKGALAALTTNLNSVSQSTPRVEKAIADLEQRLARTQDQLGRNRAEMEAIRATNDKLQQVQDQSTRRAHILGRIALYLESLPTLPDTTALQRRAEDLRRQCETLEDDLSAEKTRERIASIIALIGKKMTEWAQRLELEHSDSPLRLDLKRLTVVAETADGPLPMERMGSGENWVGYHLIGHLPLHDWFARRKRPVPRFLFLDQPSETQFEATDPERGDRAKVERVMRLIFDVVKDLAPAMQVILTEHADLDEPWFRAAVVERWGTNKKLVPEDWPKST